MDRERVQQLRLAAKQALLHRRFQEARQLLDEAIALRPDSYKLHRLRCVASACLADYESALEDAEVVVELMPGITDGYYHKGFALYQLHDYAAAAHAFQAGLAINPKDSILRQGWWDAVNLLSSDRPVGVPEQQPAAAGHTSTAAAGRPAAAGISSFLMAGDSSGRAAGG